MKAAENSIVRKRGEAGYNLIELMVAILVISISVIALYEMIAQGSQMLNEESHRGVALEKAIARMETMKSYRLSCDTIPRRLSGRFEEYLVPEGGQEDPFSVDCYVDVTHSASRREDGMPNFSHVIVQYRWNEPNTGRLQKVELQSNF